MININHAEIIMVIFPTSLLYLVLLLSEYKLLSRKRSQIEWKLYERYEICVVTDEVGQIKRNKSREEIDGYAQDAK
jgi:competence protein ComGF